MKIGAFIVIAIVAFVALQSGQRSKNSREAALQTDNPIDFDKAIIIDVRSPQEFSGGHVEGAINLPIDSISEADVLKHTTKDAPVVLYCRSGGRAGVVHGRMTEWGFTSVYNLKTQSGVESAMSSNTP